MPNVPCSSLLIMLWPSIDKWISKWFTLISSLGSLQPKATQSWRISWKQVNRFSSFGMEQLRQYPARSEDSPRGTWWSSDAYSSLLTLPFWIERESWRKHRVEFDGTLREFSDRRRVELRSVEFDGSTSLKSFFPWGGLRGKNCQTRGSERSDMASSVHWEKKAYPLGSPILSLFSSILSIRRTSEKKKWRREEKKKRKGEHQRSSIPLSFCLVFLPLDGLMNPLSANHSLESLARSELLPFSLRKHSLLFCGFLK